MRQLDDFVYLKRFKVLEEGAVRPYDLLNALPAVLGVAGFVAYQILGANKAGDEITKRILEKLRHSTEGSVPLDAGLTPDQVFRLLQHNQLLRDKVDDRDYALLERALEQQHHLNIIVYVLSVGLVAWSLYLYVQPVGATQNQSSEGNGSPNIIVNGGGTATVTQGKDAKSQSPRSEKDAERK